MILDRVFPLFPGNFHLGGEWLPSYLHEKYISGEALIVTWLKNLVNNWVAPGSLLPKPLQHPCGFVLDIFQGPSLTWPAWMVANPRRNMRWKHSNLWLETSTLINSLLFNIFDLGGIPKQ